jgi:hypothetical protein
MRRWHFVVLIIVVVIGLSGVGVARLIMPYQVDEEIRIARAQGIPTSYAECVQPVPASQDAAPYYDRAHKLSKGFWTEDLLKARQTLTSPGGPTRAQIAQLRSAFDHDNGYVAAIHAAAKKQVCSSRAARPEEGLNQFPRMGDFRDAARTLQCETHLQMWENKPVEAARTLRLALNSAKHAEALPTLIVAEVGISIDAIVDSGYKKLLEKHGANIEVDRMVRESLSGNLEPGDISRFLSGEVASACISANSTTGYRPEFPFVRRVYHKVLTPAYIHWMTRQAVASRVPVGQQRQAIQGVIDEFDRVSHGNPILRELGWVMPMSQDVMDHFDTQAARRRTIYAAACVLEYRARTGRYPVSLSQAIQSVPIDPFSRAPLSYKRTVKGFELVSAAASRRWAAQVPARRRRDMVFAYPAP